MVKSLAPLHGMDTTECLEEVGEYQTCLEIRRLARRVWGYKRTKL